MTEYIPGAPNMGNFIPKKTVLASAEVDRTFHHASLAGDDCELESIERLDQFMPYIYVSSWDCATDMNMLQSRNIKFVLNMSTNYKDEPTEQCMAKLGIVSMHIPVENVPDWSPPAQPSSRTRIPVCSFRDAMPAAFGFIKRAVDAKRNVLVHCDQGISTSPAAIAYYTLKTFYGKAKPSKEMLDQIITKFRNTRPCVDINFGFIEALEDFEADFIGRPVIDSRSLSIRRNVALKQRETKKFMDGVIQDRKQADAIWGPSVTRVKLIK